MTALAGKSSNAAYFPGELNSFALRIYFISGEACDRKIGKSRGKVTPLAPSPLHYIDEKKERKLKQNILE